MWGVLRVGSLCATTLYSVLGFSGTQSFHINVRKLVRFQHRDEKIPGRLCRESSLALSCVCVRISSACACAFGRARSPPTAAVRLRRPRPAARRAQSPRTPRMQGLSTLVSFPMRSTYVWQPMEDHERHTPTSQADCCRARLGGGAAPSPGQLVVARATGQAVLRTRSPLANNAGWQS